MSRRRAGLLWGLVGGLSFLVLLQAYELLVAVRIDLGVKFGVALAVFAVVAVVTYGLRPRLSGRNGSA